MTLTVVAETAPIRIDEDGTARVCGTRLTLDTVVESYDMGATAEEIAADFPPIALADVYAVLSYVLRHRREVDAYMREREEQARRIRALIEAHQGPQTGIRERLEARRRQECSEGG
jgi:uncharacterized protein (DUF433 family)